jgi:pilus assembly protein CpaB
LKNQVTLEQLKSLIARRIINLGEPITKNIVVDRKDRGVLSALLEEGMRAVSLGLDTNAGMAGLLHPGDIVDVILALNVTGKENENEETSRTILCGVRILALDQHLSSPVEIVNKKIGDLMQAAPKSVTLEVTPQQASALASAVKMGNLSLSLHSINDNKNSCTGSSLKPVEKIKIVRGDGTTQPSSQQGR